MIFKPMPVLTLLSIASVIILVLLGNWQYARYGEKTRDAEIAKTEPLRDDLSLRVEAVVDTNSDRYAQQVYGAIDGEPVWRRYVPATLETGERVLALWDATGGPQPVQLSLSELAPEYIRQANILRRSGKRGTFAFEDEPSENLWYSMVPTDMMSNLGFPAENVRVVETLDVTIRNSEDMSRARRSANPFAYEKMRDPLPPERHFGYAITWWGMAIALLGVYFALHHARGRLRFRS